MKPIAIFYHSFFYWGNPPVRNEASVVIAEEQMSALKSYGLLDAASEFYVGINGGVESLQETGRIFPNKSLVVFHGIDKTGELLTKKMLRDWADDHKNWYVCYLHMKGASHPVGDALTTAWRRCMEKVVVRNWRRCITDMDNGYETVGAHWLTPEQYGPIVQCPFWGGDFWWANASFIAELPYVPDHCDDRFFCERWIGTGRRPSVRDYAPHWPNIDICSTVGRS